MIAVLDYGIGNLRSAEKALQKVGADARLVDDPDVAAEADGMVLPGVGAFGPCASALESSGLGRVARDAIDRGLPFLGICVGFQLLYEGSEEDPSATGLGALPGTVRRLPDGVKHPQMQWNTLTVDRSALLAGVPDPAWVYFVHSYAPERTVDTTATCDYGGPVVAVAERGPVWGTQFHPEKSGTVGLGILATFVAAVDAATAARPAGGSTLMDLYPAIDIRGGGAVRLTQGDFDRQSDYGDPVELAARFVADGAPWLHVVDLDAARTGSPVNRATVLAIAAAVDVPVETGGGVRSESDIEELLAGGLARVILGTAALDDPGLVRRATTAFPTRVALGVDYRRTPEGRAEVAVRGWEESSGRTVADLLDEVADADLAAVVVTAIDRDGTLAGPDLDGLRAVLASTGLPVIASGGVGSVDDIAALARLGVDAADGTRRLHGAITGKALVDGRMTVAEGVAACTPSG